MKTMNLKKGLITLVFCLGMVTFSNAQSNRGKGQKEPPGFSELLEKMDANEDGKLSKEEIKGRLKDNFDKIDTDEDGFISEEEFENAPRPKGRRSKN